MKTKSLVLNLLAALVLAVGFVACAKDDPYKVGTHVAAKWSDGAYWGATVTGNANGKYQIKYDDGSQGEVTVAELKQITPKSDIKAGDHVLAVWSTNGKMYPGTVQEIQSNGAMVKWDDGSQASFVDFNNITK